MHASHRIRATLALTIWLGAILGAPAAPDSGPAPSNVGSAEHPRIEPDLRVAFRLKAPNAKQVQLRGGSGLVKDAIDLVRGEEGVWGKHLDQFAWIGAMSGPPRQGFDVKTSFDGVFNDAAGFNRKVRLLWLGAGTAEEQIHRHTLAMHDALDKAGIGNVFSSSPGTDHEWQTWHRSLHDLVPRLFHE